MLRAGVLALAITASSLDDSEFDAEAWKCRSSDMPSNANEQKKNAGTGVNVNELATPGRSSRLAPRRSAF